MKYYLVNVEYGDDGKDADIELEAENEQDAIRQIYIMMGHNVTIMQILCEDDSDYEEEENDVDDPPHESGDTAERVIELTSELIPFEAIADDGDDEITTKEV
jgi:hypothetical protein